MEEHRDDPAMRNQELNDFCEAVRAEYQQLQDKLLASRMLYANLLAHEQWEEAGGVPSSESAGAWPA